MAHPSSATAPAMPATPLNVYVSVPATADPAEWIRHFRLLRAPAGVEFRFCFRHGLGGDWLRIHHMIRAAHLVVAEFSPTKDSGSAPDPNAVTEAAAARLGDNPKPTILLHKQSKLALPFDWRQLERVGGIHSIVVSEDLGRAMRDLDGMFSQIMSRPRPAPPPPRNVNRQSWDIFVSVPMQRGDGRPGAAGFDFAQFYRAARTAAGRVPTQRKVRLALIRREPDVVDVWQRVQTGISRCSTLIADFTPDAASGRAPNPDVLTESTLAMTRYAVPVLPCIQEGYELPENWRHYDPVVYRRDDLDGLVSSLKTRLAGMEPGVDQGTSVAAPSRGGDGRPVGDRTAAYYQTASSVGRGVGGDTPPREATVRRNRRTPEILTSLLPPDSRTSQLVEKVRKDARDSAAAAPPPESTTRRQARPGYHARTAAEAFSAFLRAIEAQDFKLAFEAYSEAVRLDPWQHALFNPQRFATEEVVGAGPFGVVFRGKALPTDEDPTERRVMLKALINIDRLGQDPDKLMSNLELLKQAPTHGLLRVVDWDRYPRGEADAYYHFWTQEEVGAVPLTELIERRGPQKPEVVKRIAGGIVVGLMSAHLFHVPHLALRPSNVLVRERQGESEKSRRRFEVWLRDFGFYPDFDQAQARGRDIGWMLQLLDYAAPEQRGEIPVTPGLTSDIYSLGLIMLFALFGSPVVDMDTLGRLETLEDRDLRSAIEGCLRYDPRGRWAQLEPILALLQPTRTPVGLRESRLMPIRELAVATQIDADESSAGIDVFNGLMSAPGGPLDEAFETDAGKGIAVAQAAAGEMPEEAPRIPRLRGATREEGPLRPVDALKPLDSAPDRLFAQAPESPRKPMVPRIKSRSGKRHVIAGIDLGTCTSLLSYIDEHGDTKVIQHSQESIVTPSAVYFPEAFRAEVGLDAKRMAVFEPLNCAQLFKLNMGDSRRARPFHGAKFTPEMLSALVLRKLVEQAVDEMGGPEEVAIRDAVITVPSSWDDVRRDATRFAAKLAGLNPLAILSEPVAVTLEVSLKQLRDGKTVFVYDFGGGTFDVTIFRLEGRTVRLLANMGLPTLGGNNLDRKLFDFIRVQFRDEFADESPPDPNDRPAGRWELLSRCEQVKVALCRGAPQQTITVSSGGCTGKYSVTLDDLERIIQSEIETTRNFVLGALLEAKLEPKDIDLVLSVGGSSQIPAVQRMLAEIFGKDRLLGRSVNPQETVARGACRNAADIWCEAARRGDIPENVLPRGLLKRLGDAPILREETPQAISLVTLDPDSDDEAIEVVIPQGTTWPATGQVVAETAEDHQMNVICRLRSGSNPETEATQRLGTISFPLVPGVPKGTPLKIEFWYDGPDRLHVALWDAASGDIQTVKVPWPNPTAKQAATAQETVDEVEVVLD
jgi:molecular chaperone DnaK